MPTKTKGVARVRTRLSKLDPTRTATLRAAFARQLRKKFKRVKGSLYKWLVLDNSLGLGTPARNAEIEYASTQLDIVDPEVLGEIKAIQQALDPEDVLKLDEQSHITVRYGLHPQEDLREQISKLVKGYGKISVSLGRLSLFILEEKQKEVLKIEVEDTDGLRELNDLLAEFPHTDTHSSYNPHLTIAYLKPGTGEKYLDLANDLEDTELSFDAVTYSTPERVKTPLAVNAPAPRQFRFATTPEKLAEFQRWLRQQLASEVLGKSDQELWERYTQKGFERGAGRAFDDANAIEKTAGFKDVDFWEGSKTEFLRSAFGRKESVEKVKLLASRSFTDLRNVTEDMATKMGRILSDGLIAGKNPRDISDDLDDALDLGTKRADVIARTEIIRAHAEGQLDAFTRLGVEEVGVAVEWSTAGDDRVCDQCSAMEGVILKIEEAHGMIPAHPQCRCAFLPANVGEDDDNQTRSKDGIDAAFDEARGARGLDKDEWGAEISASRPQSMLGNLLDFSLLLNGGPGSGNFGHEGRPGEVGGSGDGGGGGGGKIRAAKAAVAAKATKVIDATPGGKWLREKAALINKKLIDRYGKKQAAAILASGQAISWGAFGVGAAMGVPIWVPSAVATLPGAALAELNYQMRGKGKDKKKEPDTKNEVQLTAEEIEQIAKELVEELTQEWIKYQEEIGE